MPDPFRMLLDAAIQDLEDLRARGVRFVGRPWNSPTEPRTAARMDATVPSTVPVLESGSGSPSVVPMANPTRAIVSAPTAGEPKAALGESLDLFAPTSPPPAPARLDPAAKEAAMAELRQRTSTCQKCPNLAAARQTVVFGVGNIHSPLLFVGEAPGADEDQQGEPFVGKAGQLLTRIIQTMGMSRESVFIANILKCRPDTPGQSSGNRKPTPDEMKTCLPYLLEQIEIIAPRVIVALGATAVEGLLGKSEGITRLRGRWQQFRGIPLMPTYHPAYLLRNQALSEKRKVWEDMLQVMERLELTITDKQRSYFLRP